MTSYKKILVMTGVDEPLNQTLFDPFTISQGGTEGDIPFAVRKHKCEMNLGTYWSPDIYRTTTDAKITFQIVHKYTTNPYLMDPFTWATINCTSWNRERSSCSEVSGTVTERFRCQDANNGTSYATLPNDNQANISHGGNSGIGITW